MTNVSKREALGGAATQLLVERGLDAPTIADIAEHAQVPAGNVYYYFKTRDELVQAVIDSRAEQIRTLLRSLDRKSDPRARLKGLTHSWAEVADLVAAHGCPLGSLSSELNKCQHETGDGAAKLFELVLDWSAEQFRAVGRKDARGLAITLFAGVQGAALLADTLGDPKIMRDEARRLESWIDQLSA
jgi:TetR/AcrR family transcriptional regulator, transcriptional repressor for nem operon